MRNILLLTIILNIPCIVFSSNAGLFNIDEQKIEVELQSLQQLEDFVVQHNYQTYHEIASAYPEISNVFQKTNFDSNLSILTEEPPWGIPSFVWGFCLSIPGVVLVYSMTKDQEELKKSMLGCILGTGLIGGCYSLMYGISSW